MSAVLRADLLCPSVRDLSRMLLAGTTATFSNRCSNRLQKHSSHIVLSQRLERRIILSYLPFLSSSCSCFPLLALWNTFIKTVLTSLFANFIKSVIPQAVSIDGFFFLRVMDIFQLLHLPSNFGLDAGYREFYIVECVVRCIPMKNVGLCSSMQFSYLGSVWSF